MKNPAPKKKTHPKRRNARRFALQAIYQWQLGGAPLEDVLSEAMMREHFEKADRQMFLQLVSGVVNKTAELDALLVPLLDRPISELNPVELAVLRLATFELLERTDVPYRVVINEALEVTKEFGAIEGYKYVNGLLDKLAPKLRPLEFKK